MKALVSCDTDNATGRSKYKTKSHIRNLTVQSLKALAIKITPPGPVMWMCESSPTIFQIILCRLWVTFWISPLIGHLRILLWSISDFTESWQSVTNRTPTRAGVGETGVSVFLCFFVSRNTLLENVVSCFCFWRCCCFLFLETVFSKILFLVSVSLFLCF